MLTDLRILDHGGVLLVELARPSKKNAITRTMYSGLTQLFVESATRDDVRVVVLCGEGNDFCAGNDLHDFLNAEPEQRGAEAIAFLRALSQIARPLVVAVEGFAVGIGTTLLLHADLVVASERARFRLPFVDLGLTPEGASSLLLARRAGYLRASELLLLGDEFSAETAFELGIVTRLVAAGQARHEAVALANRLAAKPEAALAATRQLLRQANCGEVEATLEREFREFQSHLLAPQAQQLMSAVLQRSTRPKPTSLA